MLEVGVVGEAFHETGDALNVWACAPQFISRGQRRSSSASWPRNVASQSPAFSSRWLHNLQALGSGDVWATESPRILRLCWQLLRSLKDQIQILYGSTAVRPPVSGRRRGLAAGRKRLRNDDDSRIIQCESIRCSPPRSGLDLSIAIKNACPYLI